MLAARRAAQQHKQQQQGKCKWHSNGAPPPSWGRSFAPLPARQRVRVGFKDASSVPIPVSYYTLLQVPPTTQGDAVRAVFDELLQAPTQAAYSAETLFSRAVLLKSACEGLADADLRKSYDQKLASGVKEMKVAQTDLPGALVLLQETGEYELAIQFATSWLRHHGQGGPDAPDVATCLALALCDRAGTALQGHDGSRQAGGAGAAPPSLLGACQDLERALELCKRHDVADTLQEHISDALKGYRHLYAVELLSLPATSAHAQPRAHGLAQLQAVLDEPLPPEQPALKQHTSKVEDMVRSSRSVLTASEQLRLHARLQACPALAGRPAAVASVAYDTALAYVAEGFARSWPHYVHLGDLMFQEAERAMQQGRISMDATTDSSSTAPRQSPVGLERACCAVLLGDQARALHLLGLAGSKVGRHALEAPVTPCDPEVKAFIKANSKSRDDLSDGLQALAQSWLSEAVLASFREWAAPTPASKPQTSRISQALQSLDPWFASATSRLYMQVWRVAKGNSPLLPVLHVVLHLPAVLTVLFAAPISTAEEDPTTSSTTTAASSSSSSAAPANTPPAAPKAPAAAGPSSSPRQPSPPASVSPSEAMAASLKIERSHEEEVMSPGLAGVPEKPLLAITDLVDQQDTMTVDQLAARLPEGSMPLRRASAFMPSGPAQAGVRMTEAMLRRELDRMEKAMWDSPGAALGGGALLGALTGRGQGVASLPGKLALVVAVVAVAGSALASVMGATMLTRQALDGPHQLAVVGASATR